MKEEIVIKGVSASPGIALGKVKFSYSNEIRAVKRRISRDGVGKEIERFNSAVKNAISDLERIKEEVERKKGKAAGLIFETQIILLKDKEILETIEKAIKEDLINTEWALEKLSSHYETIFSELTDEYIKSRIKDVKDVFGRVLENLSSGDKKRVNGKLKEGSILVADDIPPSIFADFCSEGNVLGLALSGGGINSHTVILARSFDIPAVIEAQGIRRANIVEGDEIIVDGIDGFVIVSPSYITKAEYIRKKAEFKDYLLELKSIKDYKSFTADGEKFKLLANIEIPEEVELALTYGAEGIGLFRTEFLYFLKDRLPTKDEHERIYSEVLKKMAGREVIIRTLDIGGEKKNSFFYFSSEENPALGKRGARYFINNPETLSYQLEGILKATRYGKVRILFPMITEIEEIKELKDILLGIARRLKVSRDKFDIGIMVEVPSIAMIIEKVFSEVDFVSIGTNDLIQYTLAVDRGNPDVSYLYNPLHPSILKLIYYVSEEGKKAKKDVQICGEMGSEPVFSVLLLAFGITHISMSPLSIPKVKRTLLNVNIKKLRELLLRVIEFSSAKEVKEFLFETILATSPEAIFKKF